MYAFQVDNREIETIFIGDHRIRIIITTHSINQRRPRRNKEEEVVIALEVSDCDWLRLWSSGGVNSNDIPARDCHRAIILRGARTTAGDWG